MVEFNLHGYEKLIEVALENNFSFQDFHSYSSNQDDRVLLLRHDIDADLNAAYQMALLEHKMGVRATYFLMLRSPVYNLFSRQNSHFVEKIINLGHTIGLHYDEGYYPEGKKFNDLRELIHNEVIVLNSIFNINVKSISFHQPSPQIVQNSIDLPGFYNTYSKEFINHFFYISDSNMIWKKFSPEYYLTNIEYFKIQLLIHPMWWVNGTSNFSSTNDIWNATLLRHFKQLEKQLISTERAYGNERQFSIN